PAGAQAATNCAACHTVSGTEAGGRVGPDLTHFASRETLAAGILDQTPENVAKWLRNPADVKPGALMPDLNLSEDEIDALVAYLLSLE
ncbi:MAG TPA: cytochrome c, partial [Dehalococcoidia bacterium]|nr:cytochrome c [Dehalococcoidia bacterium]